MPPEWTSMPFPNIPRVSIRTLALYPRQLKQTVDYYLDRGQGSIVGHQIPRTAMKL